MPSLDQAGKTLFLKRWLRRPLSVGALVPSGRSLAEAMAEATLANLLGAGPVVELGAGTGEVTKALFSRGLARERLVLIERDPELTRFLRRQFAGSAGSALIIEGDAARLPRLLAEHGISSVAAVVSSLPLLSLSSGDVRAIVSGVFEVLPPGGALVQFTYGPKPPIPSAVRERLGITGQHGPRIWRNVPPAVVWTFKRPSAA